MKARSYFLAVLAIVLVCAMVFAVEATGFNNIASQEGISVELTTDKTAYVAGEAVDVSLRIDNDANRKVKISYEITLPEGMSLKSGKLSDSNIEMDSGEGMVATSSHEVSEPTVQPTDPTVPPTDSTVPSTEPSVEPTTPSEDDNESDIPQTGDDFHYVLWIALLVLAVAGIGYLFVKRSKFISVIALFLCASMVVSMAAPLRVSAADETKTIEVAYGITVNGTECAVLAKVTYEFEGSSDDGDDEVVVNPIIPESQLTVDNAVSNAPFYREMVANWKVQLPVFKDESNTSVKEVGKNEDIPFEGYYDQWFYYDPADDAVVFYTTVNGAKTANTTYTRSELREMIGTTTADNWAWGGYHKMTVTEKVTQVSANGKTMVNQVHAVGKDGSNGPVPVKVVYQGNQDRIEVSFTVLAGGKGTKAYYFDDIKLGQEFTTTTEFIDGCVYVTIESEGRKETFSHDFFESDKAGWTQYNNYFKAGNYIQDNTDTAEDAGAVVRMYDLATYHDETGATAPVYNIEDLVLSRNALTMQMGERTQLGLDYVPAQTTNKNVVWAIDEGADCVAVDKDGYVIAMKEGTAKVSVTSVENPEIKKICTITVTEVQEVLPEVLFEQDFENTTLDEAGFTIADNAKEMITIVDEGGNSYIRIDDDQATVAGKIAHYFEAPVEGTVTLTMKVKVDAINVKDATTSKPLASAAYLDTMGVNAAGETPVTLGRWRNNSELASMAVDAANNNWGLTGSYLDAPMNTAQTFFTYGEWVDLTMITTADDGSANAGTTTYYMNGYKVGEQLDNKSNTSLISGFEFYPGTKDLMTICFDDIVAYKGAVVPESRNTTPPTSIAVDPVPETMAVGDSYKINAAAQPSSAYEELAFKLVSGDSVALNDNGYLIAVKKGTSVVRVYSTLEGADVYTDITIEVVAADEFVAVEEITLVDAEGVELSDRINMVPDKTYQLLVVFNPENPTDDTLLYEVISGQEYVTVSDSGLLTAVASGTAVVQVSSAGNASASDIITVVVVKDYADGTVLYKNNFDEALDTEDWTFASLNTGNTSITVEDGSLSVVDNNSAGQPKTYLTFGPAQGAVTFSFKLRVDADTLISNNSKTSSLRIAVGAGQITTVANETFTLKNTATVVDGTITERFFQYSLPNAADGSGVFQKVSGFELGEWVDVVMVVRTNDGSPLANTSDLYIDGVKVTPDGGTPNKVVYDTIDKFCLSTGSSDLAAYSIDDLVITVGEYTAEIPEPELVDTQDFEDMTAKPLDRSDSAAVEAETGNDANQVLHVVDADSSASVKAIYSFEEMKELFTIVFRVKVIDDTTTVKSGKTGAGMNIVLGDSTSIGLVSSSANELVRIRLTSGNLPANTTGTVEDNSSAEGIARKLTTRTNKNDTAGKSDTTLLGAGAYELDKWQTYAMVVNVANKTVDVYVDGVLVGEGCRIYGCDFDGIDHIYFNTSSDEAFEAEIDDVRIYTGDAGTTVIGGNSSSDDNDDNGDENEEITATPVVTQDFEDYANNPFATLEGGTTGVTAESDTNPNQVLHIVDDSASTTVKALYSFEEMKDVFTISFDVKVIDDTTIVKTTKTGAGMNILLGDMTIGKASSSANELVRVRLCTSGVPDEIVRKITTRTNKNDTANSEFNLIDSGAYELNKWQTYRLVVDVANKKLDVYVGTTLIAEDVPMYDVGFDGIDHIFFNVASDEAFEAQIDNIKIYTGDAVNGSVPDNPSDDEEPDSDVPGDDPVDENVVMVASIKELEKAIDAATAGTEIVIKNGTYNLDDARITVDETTDGSAAQPIIIRAETVGNVFFEGFGQIVVKGDYVTVSGITFQNGGPNSSSGAFRIYGQHVRLTNIKMDGYDTPEEAPAAGQKLSNVSYLTISAGAMYAEIDHCSFINKNSPGVLILVDRYNYDGPNYTHIHDNYFGQFTNPDPATYTNELETIRVGVSDHSQTDSYTVIENNVFEDISAESELISVKSCKNVVRGNTIKNCTAAITIRHGNTCLVEDNVILNNGIANSNGIRVFDKFHVIRNNYISGIAANSSTFYGGIVLHNGNNAIGSDNGSLNGQWTTNNVLLENNSFVNNAVNICLGDNRYEKAPGKIQLKNNLVYTDLGPAIRQYEGVIATDVSYSGEKYYATGIGLVSGTVPSGVTFSTSLSDAGASTSGGLVQVSGVGASGLKVLSASGVGPASSITSAKNKSESSYLGEFSNWPFKELIVNLPSPDEVLGDSTTVFEDDLTSWSLTNGFADSSTFEGKTVLAVPTATSAGSNSIAVGEHTGYVCVSFKFYVDDITNAKCGIKLFSGGGGSECEIARIKFEKGKLKYATSATVKDDLSLTSSYTTVSSGYAAKTWYQVDLVFVTAADGSQLLSDIYVDGAKLNAKTLTNERDGQSITHINFFTDSNSSLTNPYTFYVDDVKIDSKPVA